VDYFSKISLPNIDAFDYFAKTPLGKEAADRAEPGGEESRS